VLTMQNSSRIIYPQIPDPISEKVLQRLFTPTYDEKRWAARTVRLFFHSRGVSDVGA
jgi:hypothetical protein